MNTIHVTKWLGVHYVVFKDCSIVQARLGVVLVMYGMETKGDIRIVINSVKPTADAALPQAWTVIQQHITLHNHCC